MERNPQRSPDLAADWEAQLARDGLTPEPAPDKAVEAMRDVRESMGTEENLPEDVIMSALRTYWMTRASSKHGEHLVSQAVESQLGLPKNSVSPELIQSAYEEVLQAQHAYQNVYRSILETKPEMEFRQAAFERAIKKRLQVMLPDYSNDDLDTLLSAQGNFPSFRLQ